jgi:hypothetical protein
MQHWAFWDAGLNIEGHWVIKVYKNNLKMMLSTQNASLGMANHDICEELLHTFTIKICTHKKPGWKWNYYVVVI